jgi:hypothetical protein
MFERPVNSPPLLYCCCHLTTRLMSAHFFRGANPTRQCVHACMFTSRTCLCTALQVSLTVHVSVCMRACLPSRTCLCTALQVSLRVHVSVCMRACLHPGHASAPHFKCLSEFTSVCACVHVYPPGHASAPHFKCLSEFTMKSTNYSNAFPG